MAGILLGDDSPLRRIPAQFDRRQLLFLDGIRYAIEMAALAYRRLYGLAVHSTQKLAEGADAPRKGKDPKDQTGLEITAALLEAWSFVDSINRLRELLDAMPGLKRNTPELRLFRDNTATFVSLRNAVQHLRSEINMLTKSGEPVWGSVGWVGVSEVPTTTLRSCTIYGGTVYPEFRRPMINPLTLAIAAPVDHLTLNAHGHTVSLTDTYERLERLTRVLERIVSQSIARQFKPDVAMQAADMVVCLEIRGDPAPE